MSASNLRMAVGFLRTLSASLNGDYRSVVPPDFPLTAGGADVTSEVSFLLGHAKPDELSFVTCLVGYK